MFTWNCHQGRNKPLHHVKMLELGTLANKFHHHVPSSSVKGEGLYLLFIKKESCCLPIQLNGWFFDCERSCHASVLQNENGEGVQTSTLNLRLLQRGKAQVIVMGIQVGDGKIRQGFFLDRFRWSGDFPRIHWFYAHLLGEAWCARNDQESN